MSALKEPNLNKLTIIELMLENKYLTVRKKETLRSFHAFVQDNPCWLDIMSYIFTYHDGFERFLVELELLALVNCDPSVVYHKMYPEFTITVLDAMNKLLAGKRNYPIGTKVKFNLADGKGFGTVRGYSVSSIDEDIQLVLLTLSNENLQYHLTFIHNNIEKVK